MNTQTAALTSDQILDALCFELDSDVWSRQPLGGIGDWLILRRDVLVSITIDDGTVKVVEMVRPGVIECETTFSHATPERIARILAFIDSCTPLRPINWSDMGSSEKDLWEERQARASRQERASRNLI